MRVISIGFRFTGLFLLMGTALILLSGCERNDMYTTALQRQALYVAVGASGQVWSSSDLETGSWLDVSSGTLPLNSVAVTQDAIVVVGGSFPPADSGVILMSKDGTAWNDVTPVTGAKVMKDIKYAGGSYVAIGDDGGARMILVSDNGSSWTGNATPAGIFNTDYNLNGITCGNGLWVIAGGFSMNGEVLCSSDGVAWNVNSPSCEYLNEGTFGNDRFVLVGRKGQIIYSDDNGAAWTALTSGTMDLNGVAFGNGIFVAVGASGAIMRSNDGAAWADVSFGSESYSSITYFNNMFVAAGTNGTIIYSNDGSNWTDASPGGNSLYDVAAGYTAF